MEKGHGEHLLYPVHFASGDTEAPRWGGTNPMAHDELGAEPGWPPRTSDGPPRTSSTMLHGLLGREAARKG